MPLGVGGMGVVYRATDLTMHRPVAVKLVRAALGVALDEEIAGRFLREAKNTARIQHENIIEVYDLGRTEGDMFFVMELLEGESLSGKLRRHKVLKPELTIHIARQICAALHVAHTAGVIHRDLKPANVMLVRRGSDHNFVKVLDFGVSKSYSPDQQTQLTHTGMLVGTIEYMAPEQIMARQVDGRTDLYSLGVVMYRMLTGKPPFFDHGVPALIHAHLNVMPKPLFDVRAEIPPELNRIVLRCLAKRPEDRYASMEELSRALASAMAPADVGESHRSAGIKPRKPMVPRPSRDPEEETTAAAARPERVGVSPARVPSIRPPPDEERTTVMVRGERESADSVTRIANPLSRQCPVCRTQNASAARACSACGTPFASDEREIARRRSSDPQSEDAFAGRTPPSHFASPSSTPPPATTPYPSSPSAFGSGPLTPPSPAPHALSPAFGFGPPPFVPAPTPPAFAPGPLTPPPFAPAVQRFGPQVDAASAQGDMGGPGQTLHWKQPEPPPLKRTSIWQRLLTWTGLRRP